MLRFYLFSLYCSVSLRLWDTLFIFSLAPLPLRALALSRCIAFSGGNLPRLCHAMAEMPQQRIAPVLLPLLRQYGGASRVCRRFFARKIRNMVAAPVLPAVHVGGNFAHPAISLNTVLQQLQQQQTPLPQHHTAETKGSAIAVFVLTNN